MFGDCLLLRLLVISGEYWNMGGPGFRKSAKKTNNPLATSGLGRCGAAEIGCRGAGLETEIPELIRLLPRHQLPVVLDENLRVVAQFQRHRRHVFPSRHPVRRGRVPQYVLGPVLEAKLERINK